jgi:hypothetical protein
MDPAETQRETVATLQDAIIQMTTPEFELALQSLAPEAALQARRERQRVQQARLALENAQLAAIRDRLVENDQALSEGRRRVQQALANLQAVQEVVAAVSACVEVVGRVVSLV